jgi:RimJ/RimL family protein N-acetyltransferase
MKKYIIERRYSSHSSQIVIYAETASISDNGNITFRDEEGCLVGGCNITGWDYFILTKENES